LVTDTHSIYSIAYDAAGNQQKSDPVTIRIAPEPPKPTSSLLLDVWRDDPPAIGAAG
jgi:hypothetical protein